MIGHLSVPHHLEEGRSNEKVNEESRRVKDNEGKGRSAGDRNFRTGA
jgi:hypothetical protein